jgi:hypothetical protein
MTQIDLSKLIYHSSFSGLLNYTSMTLSYNVPSVTTTTIFNTSLSLNNKNAISQIQIQLDGIDSTWYVMKGFFQNNYASDDYTIDVYASYSNPTTLNFKLVSAVNVGGTTIPAYTFKAVVSLYEAPF